MAPNDPTVKPNQDISGADVAATSTTDEPILDMDAINEAVAATANDGNNIQNTFDVNDISLDNTPTSDAELKQQMADNPDMNLAGGATNSGAASGATSGPVDFTNTNDPIDNPAKTNVSADADKKPAETAGFVDGDISNDVDPATGETKPEEPPVVAANVVTAPGAKKSNKPLFIILGAVAALAVVIVAIIIIMSL